jgi:hypothetical protein
MALNNELAKMRQGIINVSTAALGELTGINRNRLSLYLSGTSQLPNREILLLEETFRDLERLISAANPFPLSFQNVALIRELIHRSRLGEFNRKEEQQ